MTLGQITQSYFTDNLIAQKGLLTLTVRSYRDTLKLYLAFVSRERHRPISRLAVEDLSLEGTLRFLTHLEEVRHNQVVTRNQRLAALHGFFEYLARRDPACLMLSQQIALIPLKRSAPRAMRFLEENEVKTFFQHLPTKGRFAVRDRALLLFLYNTGARVQEVCDLRLAHLELGTGSESSRVHLHGKGNKWRVCPLWSETARQLKRLAESEGSLTPDDHVFQARPGRALTRFGVYKIVRRLSAGLEAHGGSGQSGRISPHVWRHTAAVHLLESGVEINVVRGWLGHVSLETTNCYAEITARLKEEALHRCELPSSVSAVYPRKAVWRDDENLLKWLDSL